MSIPILNLAEARFECTFGRGCEGTCCRNGRPPVYAEEEKRIDRNLHKFIPELRPEVRAVLEGSGYLSNRRKAGQRMLRVLNGWCVFFNGGCVLHKVGAAEGNRFLYKPAICGIFPLALDKHDRWHVRQKGFQGEIWDLPCLDPGAGTPQAATTLQDEIAFLESFAGRAALKKCRQSHCAVSQIRF